MNNNVYTTDLPTNAALYSKIIEMKNRANQVLTATCSNTSAEEYYLLNNPDVWVAVLKWDFYNGYNHWLNYDEGRLSCRNSDFSADYKGGTERIAYTGNSFQLMFAWDIRKSYNLKWCITVEWNNTACALWWNFIDMNTYSSANWTNNNTVLNVTIDSLPRGNYKSYLMKWTSIIPIWPFVIY